MVENVPNVDELFVDVDIPNGYTPFIVTEVTRMKAPTVCVAAIDVSTDRLVRPLQWNHANWISDPRLVPGRLVVQARRSEQHPDGYPHQTEDVQVRDAFRFYGRLSGAAFYRFLAARADEAVTVIFPDLIDEKYVVEHTISRSLGSVVARNVSVAAPYEKPRVRFSSGARTYEWPLTSLAALSIYEEIGADEMNRRLIVAARVGPIVLRVGLARPWDGGANSAYDPRRCYAQVNGIVGASGSFEY